ncbi:acetate--CoA ligase family protein [Methylobacterium mesophilicum SR1.6/6]|uniref:Acetate--CoA ligase family protein n=1 Tax=Methylobacterium mesophilicum SR1.6/6 TaxID=908290 RepID=A0A6B9FJQ2_9HYPH|nr:acetate--CoA ligase family protein [Methylobacterium mesophilicum]QGY01966.1 acetate--CoA ligase family protein [Methylobacterium mesophilicum SR1.6/6]
MARELSHDLGPSLFRPERVAVVGASDDVSKTTARPLRFLRRSGFAGAVYPVNPRRETVLGERAWPSIESLPETPDHAFVLAPTEGVPEAVAACVARGVPLVSVLAGGFGEVGEAGRAREAELTAILAGSRTRLLGPNSIGIVNVNTGLVLTANAAFAEPTLPRGGLFVASHSGSMIGAILSRGLAKGIGFAGFVSTGAELDLSLGEICAATLDDPLIDTYALFLESIAHGRAIRSFALAAAARGKAVIAYKLGRSAQGAELSQSHTGAIAGEDGIADAFLKDCGICRVETLEGLIEGPAMLRRAGPAAPSGAGATRRPQVAVVTTTGGGAAMVVDQFGLRDVAVMSPSAETMAALAARGVAAAPGRIVDLTLAGTRPAVMRAALETLLAAPEFDVVVAVAGSSARFQPELLVPGIVEAAAGARKPLVAFVAPEAPEALARLAGAGIPCFRTPEACGDVVAAVLGRRPAKPMTEARTSPARPRQLDEAEGYAVLDRLGIPVAPHAVVAPDATTSPIGYPAAVKLLSADVLHKTELGGVVLGVRDDDGLREALVRIARDVPRAAPEVAVERLLVQEMAQGVGEVLLSLRRDPEAGPVVMLAAGGILAEIHRDRSLRLAPVDRAEALAMIGEVRAIGALAGYRGRPRGDLDALADAVVAISRAGPEIVEAEINPLIVRRAGHGVVAVDAVVRCASAQGGAGA